MALLGIIVSAALALVAPLDRGPATPTAAKGKSKAKQTRKIAAVRLEIKLENGDIVQTRGTLEWSEQGALSIDGDDGLHDVSLAIKRVPKSLALKITLGYERNGNPIVAPFEFDGKLWKREVVRIEGGLSIAVTVTPKSIEIKPEAPERNDLDVVGGDDPLGGL